MAAYNACLPIFETAWPVEWVERVRSQREKAQADIIRWWATK